MDPSLGEAFWSLADLKTYRFGDGEIDQMRDGLARNRLPPTERAAFHFALGKALEDRNEADSAFEHYAAGNAIKHRVEPFDGAAFSAQRERIEHTLTADFLAALDRGGEHSRGRRPGCCGDADFRGGDAAFRFDPSGADPGLPFRRARHHGTASDLDLRA